VKVLNPFDITNLQKDVAITFFLLKNKTPPSFFDIMTHLLLYVIHELDVCGPIHNKWMYSVDTSPNSLIDSNASSKVKTTIEGIEVHSFVRNTSGVKRCARALGWGLGKMTSKSIIHIDLHKPNNKLVNVY